MFPPLVIATSGIDYNVKLWEPVSKEVCSLEDLTKVCHSYDCVIQVLPISLYFSLFSLPLFISFSSSLSSYPLHTPPHPFPFPLYVPLHTPSLSTYPLHTPSPSLSTYPSTPLPVLSLYTPPHPLSLLSYKVIERNNVMLEESRNTITMPSMIFLRVLSYLNRTRRSESGCSRVSPYKNRSLKFTNTISSKKQTEPLNLCYT